MTLPNRSAPYFSRKEFDARLAKLRRSMAEHDVEVCLLSAPENIFYLTGLDHWGYFAPHLLIVPAGGEMVLVTRAMERVTIASHVRNARFEGHQDNETRSRCGGRGSCTISASRPDGSGMRCGRPALPHGSGRSAEARLPGRPMDRRNRARRRRCAW